MNYDNWKLQTPPEGSRGLYADYYENRIEELGETESTLVEKIVETIESIKKINASECIFFTGFGGYYLRRKYLIRLNRRLNKLKAYQQYIIEKINEYKQYLEE